MEQENLGAKWLELRKHRELERDSCDAKLVIDKIPALIEQNGLADSLLLFERLLPNDVAGSGPSNGVALYQILRQERRPLCASDLAGRAKIVFNWCEGHGLECFLKPDGDNYAFCIRPKPPR